MRKKNKKIGDKTNKIIKELLGDTEPIDYIGSKTAKLIYDNLPASSNIDLAIDIALNLKTSHNSDFKAHKSSPKDCLTCYTKCIHNHNNKCFAYKYWKDCKEKLSNPS